MEGTVKWYNFRKGYGFIQGEDGEDYFVHYTAVPKGLRVDENDKVSFDPIENEKGKQATNLQMLEKAPREARKPRPAPATEDDADEEPTLEDDETEADVQDDAEEVAEEAEDEEKEA